MNTAIQITRPGLGRTCNASVLAILLASGAAQAQTVPAGQIVVTSTGTQQDRDASGQAISVIDLAAIERTQARSIADVLQLVPSVRSNSTGSLGSVTGVSLRGAEIGQTLVLIDGVRVNDPSSTTNAVDFGNLLIANVRRIEVLRGSNAVAFGSEAIGGVIDISTRDDAAGDGFALRGSGEAGHAGTVQGAFDLGWRDGGVRVNAGLAGLRTDGISSADPRFGASERDGLENWTGHARIEAPLGEGISVDLRGYVVEALLDYDSFFGAPADSADTSLFRQATGYGAINAATADGAITSRLAVTVLANRRDYRFAPGNPVDFGFRGNGWRLDYQGRIAAASSADVLFGYSHDAPEYSFFGFGSQEVHQAETDSVFGMLLLRPAAGLALTAGVRHDHHSQFGGVTTLGFNGNWGLGDGKTRIRAAFGEGFRTPSLYQLYDGFSGNRALVPERSVSVDLGLDRSFAEGRGHVAVTAFTRTTRNQIDFDLTTFVFGNLARTRARGLEVEAGFAAGDGLVLALAYSLIDTRNRSPLSPRFNQHLPRRPVHGVTVSLDKQWALGLSTGVSLRFASEAVDPTAPTELPRYALLDLRASMPIGAQFELFGRVDNVLDSDHTTAYGYSSYGRAAFGGIRVKL